MKTKTNNDNRFSPFELMILEAMNSEANNWLASGSITNLLTSRCQEKVHKWVQAALEDLFQKKYIIRQQMILPTGQTDVVYEYRITDEVIKLISI